MQGRWQTDSPVDPLALAHQFYDWLRCEADNQDQAMQVILQMMHYHYRRYLSRDYSMDELMIKIRKALETKLDA